ncbi:NAD(P)/FAD-dependent oxidoreductase [Desertibaculum subflavum]|uniref:NAD(P)/FAD-dependent oxidoreductase n=1 Tax=Desertibaculum subflavum TaxID=2268458 RepID=UPI000E663D2D
MAEVVVLGAGLGGVLQAYELKAKLGKGDRLTVVSKGSTFHFVPSNPWVAVDWRTRDSIEVDLRPIFARLGIGLITTPAERVVASENAIVLENGERVPYDFLVVATGPDLAFDEIQGLGPAGFTQSICHVDHAVGAAEAFRKFAEKPGPIIIGAAQGASCFGPAYEFAFILDTELRRRRIRDRVPMTFVTAEPYIGHLGLDGVGDTKGLLEGEMRGAHIKWMTSSRIRAVTDGQMAVEHVDDSGTVAGSDDLPFAYSMILPAFRGVKALAGNEGLTNPRGFVIVDKFQRNPTHPNIFAVGVCVAIPPVGKSPVPVGVPKTGFMIESMVTAVAENIGLLLRGQEARYQATWNAVCLADFGDRGVAFIAQPQIPPRNINWAKEGKWVHFAKIGFEKYFIGKIRRGESEPFYERLTLDLLGIRKLKEIHPAA